MKRFQVGIVTLAALLAMTSFVPADSDEDEPLEIYAFVGNVINNFSAKSRNGYVNGEEADGTGIELMAGLEFRYALWKTDRQEWSLYGEFIHSSRVLESSCEDSESADCQANPNPEDFLEIVVVWDARPVEWASSGRLGRFVDVDILPVIGRPLCKNVG